MRLKNFLTMMLVALCTMACSDDDTQENAVIPAQEIAGTYTGTLSVGVGSQTMNPTENYKVVAEAEQNGTVKVTLAATDEEGGMSFPEISLSGIQVSKTDGMYTLAETPIDVTVEGIAWVGNLSGMVKDKQLNLDYTCTPGAMSAMGMTIKCTYIGSK